MKKDIKQVIVNKFMQLNSWLDRMEYRFTKLLSKKHACSVCRKKYPLLEIDCIGDYLYCPNCIQLHPMFNERLREITGGN